MCNSTGTALVCRTSMSPWTYQSKTRLYEAVFEKGTGHVVMYHLDCVVESVEKGVERDVGRMVQFLCLIAAEREDIRLAGQMTDLSRMLC